VSIITHTPKDENPHIYVKKHTQNLPDGRTASLLIVNDTGCGTSVSSNLSRTGQWNIRTFIDHHLNPSSSIPYLVILSHCHYDHILGLNPILRPAHMTHSTRTLIVSSAYDPSFISPSNLRKHSLCGEMGLRLPPYHTSVWAQHAQVLEVVHPKLGAQVSLPVTTFHTPGHTPDSLSWYDRDERALYVGDAFYETPAPILFPNEGDLKQWWESVDMLIAFVQEQNVEGASRVTLCAGHVTAGVDALDCLLGVKTFMARVLRNEVHFEEDPMKRGERFGSWREDGGRFSLGAPLRLIEEGRKSISREAWMESVKLL
jgi:glyoxylase-like metal-dependent hydrolase (beta-lactamase superfamily II)